MPQIILISVILLPIVPAFLLFWALPSTAIVSGLLQGLKINLGGAFGGYFAVVLLVIASHNILFPPPIPPYQVWEVSGQVTDAAGKPIEPLSAKDVTLVPPPLEPNVAGTFKLKFYSWLGPSNEVEFPTLAVSHDDGKVRFESRMIDLNSISSGDLVITRAGHSIQIKRISLNGISQAYQSPNVTLKQVPYSAESTTLERPQ